MATVASQLDLTGRVALITGGAGHLGRAFAAGLAELGATVALLDLDVAAATSMASDLQAQFGHPVLAIGADVTDPDSVQTAVASLQDKTGRLDILVNNAAYPPGDKAPDGLAITAQHLERWDRDLKVMLNGTFVVTQAAFPALQTSGNGTIINIASIYGLVGPDPSLYADTTMGNPAYYAAAKGGIVQLTRYWATTMAPAVRVNCLAPGGIERSQPAVFQNRYAARTPLGRMATEADIVGGLVFLASDLSRYVTGQVLAVDGGWTAW
ncbi:MAG: SDR family oxidoreductase [Candidatus Sericytochromatia bacterium]|nr:SDR family oxidoreductase [Candidatus Sericytochromatia bacterium]